MPFTVSRLSLSGLLLFEPHHFQDERGWFAEQYRHSDFVRAGGMEQFVQDNVSFSVHGVIRGLHYQVDPAEQAKLVAVLEGEVYDVAVDLRIGSSTYLQWTSVLLSAERGSLLYIPAGFAHGFAVVSETAVISYKCSAEYEPACERGIRWDDPTLGIEWPVTSPIVSPKDRELPLVAELLHGKQPVSEDPADLELPSVPDPSIGAGSPSSYRSSEPYSLPNATSRLGGSP